MFLVLITDFLWLSSFVLLVALVMDPCVKLLKASVVGEADSNSFLFQLYEIFTCLGELGAIAQVHAENGDIIAQVTPRSPGCALCMGLDPRPVSLLVPAVLHELFMGVRLGPKPSAKNSTCPKELPRLGGGNEGKQGRKPRVL